MNSGTINKITILPLLCVLAIAGNNVFADIAIHLPREIVISESIVTLGNIGIMTGDQELMDQAQSIQLGQLVNPREGIVVDRYTILSRLAANDIKKNEISFTGADEVQVRIDNTTVTGAEIAGFAKSFLKRQGISKSVFSMTPRRVPESVVLSSEHGKVSLSAMLLRSGSKSQAKVRVFITSGDKEVGKKDVAFELKYKNHIAVATKEIEMGGILTINNIKIEETISSTPQNRNWKAPLGYVAKRNLPAGIQIKDSMLQELLPEVIIERHQAVVIKVEQPGFLITAMGKALEDGRRGELIKVRNADSQRIVVVEVNSDGTVRPIL